MKRQPDHEKAGTNPYDLNSPSPAQSRKDQKDKTQYRSDPYNLDSGPAVPDTDPKRPSRD